MQRLPDLSTILNDFTSAIASVVGAVVGTIVAFFATYYACVLVDAWNGAAGGDGLATVGWLFCVVTIPVGLYCGAYMGHAIAQIGARRPNKTNDESTE